MSRYFLEVTYNGNNYSGFQVQENANTIQAEIEKAFSTIQRESVVLTGSSRTDSGVHAIQNYFHFDLEKEVHTNLVYKLNALLPHDIAIKNLIKMPDEAHCRFDAISRSYEYRIHRRKDPFAFQRSYYFPYKLNMAIMHKVCELVILKNDFYAFSKTNTQVKNFNCKVMECVWEENGEYLLFKIRANRFLRGMVRALTGTMLKLGREKITMDQFELMFESEEKSGFSVPGYGLYLKNVSYPENYFSASGLAFTAF
jgi:tRNA pseudouridine38-40 synthase